MKKLIALIVLPMLFIGCQSWNGILAKIPEAGFTKFKSIKLYGTNYADQIDKEVGLAGRIAKSRFKGKLPKDINRYIKDLPNNYKNKLIPRYMKYLDKMEKR